MTVDAYQKRGWNPDDEQAEQISDARKDALADLKEAAEAQNGLFDLPLKQDNPASAISQGGPYAYSEASPYAWVDAQQEAINGGG